MPDSVIATTCRKSGSFAGDIVNTIVSNNRGKGLSQNFLRPIPPALLYDELGDSQVRRVGNIGSIAGARATALPNWIKLRRMGGPRQATEKR
jgi:hypothetical protein